MSLLLVPQRLVGSFPRCNPSNPCGTSNKGLDNSFMIIEASVAHITPGGF